VQIHSIENHQDTLTPVNMTRLPSPVLNAIRKLEADNTKVYMTGQAARDLVTGEGVLHRRNLELITDQSVKKIRKLVATWDHGNMVQSDRGYDEIHLDSQDEGGHPYRIRVSPMRRTTPSYRWFQENTMQGIILDLATREITAQAFAIESNGTVIDPFGGVEDLRNGTIQTIIPHHQLFREGSFWHLKLAKYIGYYGFKPSPTLLKFAQRYAGNILDGSPHHLKSHLDKILLSHHPGLALDFLYDSKVLHLILPEVKAMVGFHKSCAVHHKDLWDHTKQVIGQAERNLPVRWAALMHDIGKIETRSVNAQGKVHFFRHEELGALLFRGIAHRLCFSEEEETRVHYIIANHSRVNLYHPDWSDGAVRRVIRECEGYLPDLVAFSKADFTTKRQSKIDELKRHIADFEQRVERIREEDARVPPLPKGLGNLIMKHFGLPPGKRIGEIRDWLEQKADTGQIDSGESGEYYLKELEKHRDELELPPPA